MAVMDVKQIPRAKSKILIEHKHYAHKMPTVSFAYGLIIDSTIAGVCTFGPPASRHVQKSACPINPNMVIELNRLVLLCNVKNHASFLVSRALKKLPSYIVISYADTAQGHVGYVYRACNFYYAGYTDMDRKTPRFDYVTPGKHSRCTFRNGEGKDAQKVRRKPKFKYWTVSGHKRNRRLYTMRCAWPKLDWHTVKPEGF